MYDSEITGRSVSACQQAYNSLASRMSLPPPQPSPLGTIEPPRNLKRPYVSLGEIPSNSPRDIQPRPPTMFQPMNGQQQLIFPPPMAPVSPVTLPPKKRGRPTKAEWEQRQAEAQERGEVWPKPRKAKARPSTEAGESSKAMSVPTPSSASSERIRIPPDGPEPRGLARTPSPDASRSASGGPVQPQQEAPCGPEGPGSTATRILPGSERLMQGIQHHPFSGEPPHPASGPQTESRPPQQRQEVSSQRMGSPMQRSSYAGSGSHDTPQELRGR